MAIVGNLPKARGLGVEKISSTQASITGTGAIATGLATVDTGGAVVSVANSGTTTPWTIATISSVAAGTVNVVVLSLAAAPTIGAAGGALLVNCVATGR